ncbi:MAG: peptide chain release factor 1 [Bacteroidota bacterium]
MKTQIEKIKIRFDEVEKLIQDPSIVSNKKKYIALYKEYGTLHKILVLYDKYTKVLREIEDTEGLLIPGQDEDFVKMTQYELQVLLDQARNLKTQLNEVVTPKDPNDNKHIILEIKSGTGGNEANIWAGDLFRMYQRYAENKNWKLEILDYTEGSAGGYKEIISTISGHQVYGTLKNESGIHRVQRVPATESQGRLHTSAGIVVVLPEIDEVNIDIDMNDVRKDTFCASGPGGQSVNTTYSAVRLTHLPTGIVATCQDEKSQLKNYEKALKVLRARLYEQARQKQQAEVGETRKSMVGSGDRSEKIRTYNYPQDRVTDHRINYTTHNLSTLLDGKIDDLIAALQKAKNN